jgi:hypothetical protein
MGNCLQYGIVSRHPNKYVDTSSYEKKHFSCHCLFNFARFSCAESDLKDSSLDVRKLKNVLVKRGSWNPDR